MRDEDLRALVRKWHADPTNLALLTPIVAGRRRAGIAPAEPLAEPPTVLASSFSSTVPLTVHVGDDTLAEGIRHVGDTRFGPVTVPACRRWGVEPFANDFARGVEVVRERKLPGIRIPAAVPKAEWPALRRLEGLESLRWVEVRCDYQRAYRDDDLAFLGTLPALEELGIHHASGLTSATIAGLVPCQRLARLRLDHFQSKAFVGGALGRLTALRRLEVWLSDLTREGLEAVGELDEPFELATNASLSDEDYAPLARLTSLASLRIELSKYRSTEAALVHLWPLGQLTSLEVKHERNLGDLGLASIGALGNLRRLSLAAPKIAGLAAIAPLERLESLRIESRDGRVKPSCFEPLARLSLHELDLGRSRFPPAALAPVGKIASLRRLILRDCQLSDAALAHLSGLRELEKLDLGINDVTNVGLEHLDRNERLRLLEIDLCEVTRAGIERFGEVHPGCEVRAGSR